MTFVIQSVLLLISGVYYPIEVLPPWMQVLSHLSPATYVLDGVRGALIHGRGLADQVNNLVPLVDHGDRVHPAGAVGIRPGGALRQAHRQVEARRVSGMNAALDAAPSLESLGWDVGFADAFANLGLPAGAQAARVVTEHRGAYRVASGEWRVHGRPCGPAALRRARPVRPAGRRRLGGGPRACDPGRPSAPIGLHTTRPGPPGRRPVAGRQRRHRVPCDLAQPRLQPPPAGALPRDGVVERRTARGGAVEGRPCRGPRREGRAGALRCRRGADRGRQRPPGPRS